MPNRPVFAHIQVRTSWPGRQAENRKTEKRSRKCSRGCSPKSGCSKVGLAKVLFNRSSEHLDFGEHPGEHSQEHFLSVTQRGAISKCEQTQTNADKQRRKRKQTQRRKRRGANASKREQTWTNANKRLHPPLLRFLHPPLQTPYFRGVFQVSALLPCHEVRGR